MKPVSRPIRLPQDLREAVTALHIDPAGLMQRYIDNFRFYPHFSTRSDQEKSGILSRIRHGMTDFQRSGKIYVDPVLSEINHRYGKLLIRLSNKRSLSPKQHDNQSITLLNQWEKEVRPLINYPEELMLEGGGVLRLSFNFMLVNMDFRHKIRKYIQMYMRRISMAHLYAHAYPGNQFNNTAVMDFFENLWDDQQGVFLPRSAAQTAVIVEYGKKFQELFESVQSVKNYKKRLLIFRPLIREWSERMKDVSHSLAQHSIN